MATVFKRFSKLKLSKQKVGKKRVKWGLVERLKKGLHLCEEDS